MLPPHPHPHLHDWHRQRPKHVIWVTYFPLRSRLGGRRRLLHPVPEPAAWQGSWRLHIWCHHTAKPRQPLQEEAHCPCTHFTLSRWICSWDAFDWLPVGTWEKLSRWCWAGKLITLSSWNKGVYGSGDMVATWRYAPFPIKLSIEKICFTWKAKVLLTCWVCHYISNSVQIDLVWILS